MKRNEFFMAKHQTSNIQRRTANGVLTRHSFEVERWRLDVERFCLLAGLEVPT